MAKKPVSYLAGSMLLGTAIGAVVGLLAAPRSGQENRDALRATAQDLSKLLPKRLDRLQTRGRKAVKQLPAMFNRKKGSPYEVESDHEGA